MSKHSSKKLLYAFIFIAGIAIGFIACMNIGNEKLDITKPIEDQIQKDIMENAVENLCPAEGEAPEDICPAEMQAAESSEDGGVYILIKTKNHDFEMNF